MSVVKDICYFSIQAWMVTKLKLKTVERDCYAIIFGYSQDGESFYHGSISYLSELTGYSKNSVCTALKNLTSKNLIIKDETEINNIKFCRYKINFEVLSSLYGIQALCIPVQAACTNNIVNNKNTLSKDNDKATPEFNFGVSDEKSKKRTNNEEYLDACLLINNFTDDKELKKLLGELLDNRLSLASNQRHHFYASTFKHYLDELSKVNDKIGAVKLSLQYNNTLRVMEPRLQYVSITSTPDTNTAPQVKYSSDEDRISKMARNDDGTPMTF